MISLADKIIFEPIGYVKTNAEIDAIRNHSAISEIIINQDLAEGLNGISSFSHLFVIFLLNQITPSERKTMKVHPRGRRDLPLIGVFATRTMLRPNPVGLTVVECLKIERNILTVKGLDAFDNTPVIDIKPYDPWDKIEKPKVPNWWKKLEEEKTL